MTASAPLLEMRAIRKRFGGTQALAGVDLQARAGEVLALVGENGAGKSTLMKVLAGAHRADSGTMQLGGEEYAPRGPHDARARGVAMIYQELNLALDLSVEDNIMLGREQHTAGWLRRNRQRRGVREALDLLGHHELKPETRVGRLSTAARQLVEIARALVGQSRVIVFDEPTSSLTQADMRHLFGVVRKLKAAGMAVIYISHFLEEVREVCDRYTVLRDGATVGSGSLSEATEAQIVALMVGREVNELFPKVPHTPGEAILSLEGLTGRRTPRDVNLVLRRGEILGIAGLVGAGRSEMLRCLFALDPTRRGQVVVAGNLCPSATRARMQAGLGLVSEDRKGEGLAQSRSIADNLTLSGLAHYSTAGWLNLRRRSEQVEAWMQRMKIKARGPEQRIEQLSGGNQQKVAIARVLHQPAEILLLDEPTRGIDVATKIEIYRMLGEQAAAGKAIVFVSSYLPELLAVCDRIGVMSRGRLREVRPAEGWTEESVMACAIAGDEVQSA